MTESQEIVKFVKKKNREIDQQDHKLEIEHPIAGT